MACLACVIVGACDGAPVQRSARRSAEAQYAEAMDRLLRLEFAAADAALRRSLVADPTYLAALFELRFTDPTARAGLAAFIDSIAAHVEDPDAAYCAATVAAFYRGIVSRRPRPNAPKSLVTLCDDYAAFVLSSSRHPREFDGIQRHLAAYPDALSLVRESLGELLRREQWDELAEAAREHTGRTHRPLVRATAYAALATAEHERGRDAAAAAAERAVRTDPAWRLPGFRVVWAIDIRGHPFMHALNRRPDPLRLARHVDSIADMARREILAASALGDAQARLALRFDLAQSDLDRGRIAEATRALRDLAALADTLGDLTSRAFVRMRLGRALVKGGQSAEAERVLLGARAIADSTDMPMAQKEVEHNLLHLYEGLGRYREAREAGERFVRFAGAGHLDPVRMMSARDLGMFLRARGAVGESRPYFERMLADVDSLQSDRYYAGEYRELTGDPEGARAYYELALADATDQLRALEGLVRVSLAMGDTAAARRWATRHDARRDAAGRPESSPMLPGVLGRTADRTAARAAFDQARRDVARHGQVAAWASLTVELAALEADDTAFARSRVLADSAAVDATRVGAHDVARRATALAAYASVRVGGTGAPPALRELMSIARAGDRTAAPLLRAELHLMAAAALATAGRWTDALGWYRRAAAPLDSVAAVITLDPRQAAFRSAQRRVYDEALATIAAHRGEPGATDAFAWWSIRRKGRAYAVQLPSAERARLQGTAPGTALVDYVLLESTVVAMVVTSAGATIVPLAVRPGDVTRDVSLLRRALDVRVGSVLDVRRARYPLGVAHVLYRALIAPIEPFLAGARTIIVVPDGIVALVPFDALVTTPPPDDGDERRATFLIDRYTVVSAVTIGANPAAWRLPAGRIAVIAPSGPPAVASEAGAIAGSVPAGRLIVLRDSAATRRATVAAARQAGVVHFAAHAVANERDPGASWIGLAPDGDDGTLRASDVAALTLDAPLVVLSACETANGLVLDGEGVLSLSRSFLRAGARATVATLWPVGAPAAAFAGAFYANLARSADVAAALRNAKLAMRARGTSAFAWAPYLLVAGSPPATAHTRPLAARH